LHLEVTSSEICDLVLGSAGDQTRLVARLVDSVGRLWARQDEQGALKGLTSQACGPVLGVADEVPPLAVALFPSLSPKLTEAQVDAAAINGFQLGSQLALTAALSHFPELQVELDLLGTSYNADLMSD
jgi:hypothetical protein